MSIQGHTQPGTPSSETDPDDTLRTESGILSLHKPVGPSSRAALDIVEDQLTDAKLGHAGTLDPLAEGVLPLMVNEATKLVPYLQTRPKQYRVRIRFDLRSESHDLGESPESISPDKTPDRTTLRATLDRFEGNIQQKPPLFSAIKSGGDRLHERQRRGESVSPDPRTVNCHDIRVLDYSFPALVLAVTCGKGFYIRALARDLAAELSMEGGLVTSLVRQRYGPFSLAGSVGLSEPSTWPAHVSPPREAVRGYHWIHCTAAETRGLINGQWIDRDPDADVSTAMAIGPDQQLHAILSATNERSSDQWRPVRVLNRNNGSEHDSA